MEYIRKQFYTLKERILGCEVELDGLLYNTSTVEH